MPRSRAATIRWPTSQSIRTISWPEPSVGSVRRVRDGEHRNVDRDELRSIRAEYPSRGAIRRSMKLCNSRLISCLHVEWTPCVRSCSTQRRASLTHRVLKWAPRRHSTWQPARSSSLASSSPLQHARPTPHRLLPRVVISRSTSPTAATDHHDALLRTRGSSSAAPVDGGVSWREGRRGVLPLHAQGISASTTERRDAGRRQVLPAP